MEEGETKFALVEDKDIKKELGDDEISKRRRCRIIIIVCTVVIIIAVALILYFVLRDSDSEKEKDPDPGKKELKFLTWEEAQKKAKEKIKEFTTEEKFNLLFGTDNMKTPAQEGGCVGQIDPI